MTDRVPVAGLDEATDRLLGHLLQGGLQAIAKIKDLVGAVGPRPVDDAMIEDTTTQSAGIRATPGDREEISTSLETRRAAWVSGPPAHGT